MAACPSCHRPVAVARATCLYCGQPLPEEDVAAAQAAARGTLGAGVVSTAGVPAKEPAPGPGGVLLVVEAGSADAATLGRALDLPRFEAQQLQRRGGLQLLRAGSEEELSAEAERLLRDGLRVHLVPEPEARRPARRADQGRFEPPDLLLRTPRGWERVKGGDLLIVVRGPIQREYQARAVERNKPRTVALDPGYLFHLHLRAEPGPLELDPAEFVFGGSPVPGSSLAQMTAWIQELAASVPDDDAFKRMPPALAPAAPPEGAAASLRHDRGRDAPTLLDTTAQFRFYSGWRAGVERRR
jgi:hypothetical protein